MKIQRATIYGFGKWVDYTIDFSKSPATCIYGDNESGKSTIQKFILFMLFGLPPKQRAFYRPKISGKMGGQLIVDHPEVGSFRIERVDEVKNGSAVCFSADGEIHDEAWLHERLNGLDEKTYRSIFSFSALDLTEIRNMKDEDLGDVLLGIGLTGSTSIYSVEKRLDAQIGELFKPSGKKPVMNQQLDHLNRISHDLKNYREQEETYKVTKEAIKRSNQQLSELQKKLKLAREKAFSLEKQLHAQPVIQEYHQLKTRLSDYPTTIDFPENGIERLEKWKESLLPLQSEWHVIQENEKNYKNKIGIMEQHLHADAILFEAEELLKQKQAIDTKIDELEKLKSSENNKRFQVNEEIERLHLGMQVEELTNIELPFYVEKSWMQLRNEAEQVKLEAEQLDQEQYQLKQEKNYLLNQIEQLEQNLLTDNQVHELRDRVNTFNESRLMQQVKEDENAGRKAWLKNKNKKKKEAAKFLKISLIIAIAALAGAFITDWNSLYVVMAMMILLGIGQWLMAKRSIHEMDNMFQLSKPNLEATVTEAEKKEAEELLELYGKKSNELAALQEQEKLGRIQFVKWNEKKKIHAEKERRLEEQIRHQYNIYPFLERLEIAYWPELYHSLKQVLKAIKEWEELVNERIILRKQIGNFERSVDDFFTHADLDHEATSLTGKLEAIEKIVKIQKAKRHELSHYQQLLDEITLQQHKIKQKMQTYESEIQQLFHTAGVDSEEAFYQQAKKLHEKNAIDKDMEKAVSQILKMLPEHDVKRFINNPGSEANLEIDRKETESVIEQIEASMEHVREELADKKAQLAVLESSESFSNSMHQFEMEKEKLNKMAKEWAILKTAKEMLSVTKKHYRNHYLTKVIEVTTVYFQEITENAYIQVYAPTDTNPFQVESSDNIRYTVNELSQGTVDQLYVSLRLAISQIMSENHGLPFIIDDAFVHFDADRTKRILSILSNTAKKQQVIFFTCKQDIADAASTMNKVILRDTLHEVME